MSRYCPACDRTLVDRFMVTQDGTELLLRKCLCGFVDPKASRAVTYQGEPPRATARPAFSGAQAGRFSSEAAS